MSTFCPRHQEHHHHPHHDCHHGSAVPGSSSSAAAAAAGLSSAFTPTMRDRQARGKDTYRSGDASDASDVSDRESGSGSKLRLGGRLSEKEDFSKIERREKAVAFLDNPELLMMYAQSTGDSIPAVRLHFMKMMCGYDDESLDELSHGSGRSARGPANTSSSSRPRRDMDKRRGGDRAASGSRR